MNANGVRILLGLAFLAAFSLALVVAGAWLWCPVDGDGTTIPSSGSGEPVNQIAPAWQDATQGPQVKLTVTLPDAQSSPSGVSVAPASGFHPDGGIAGIDPTNGGPASGFHPDGGIAGIDPTNGGYRPEGSRVVFDPSGNGD